MIDNLPEPILLYITAENSGDVNLFDHCFVDNAVVRDEDETHTGLGAIKKWKAETKRKYQHSVEPLASTRLPASSTSRHPPMTSKFSSANPSGSITE